jgi:hypothetical protein
LNATKGKPVIGEMATELTKPKGGPVLLTSVIVEKVAHPIERHFVKRRPTEESVCEITGNPSLPMATDGSKPLVLPVSIGVVVLVAQSGVVQLITASPDGEKECSAKIGLCVWLAAIDALVTETAPVEIMVKLVHPTSTHLAILTVFEIRYDMTGF